MRTARVPRHRFLPRAEGPLHDLLVPRIAVEYPKLRIDAKEGPRMRAILDRALEPPERLRPLAEREVDFRDLVGGDVGARARARFDLEKDDPGRVPLRAGR